MRVDANVSVRRPGAELGTRCEIKNVNSVRSVGRAIEYEARRQIQLIEGGERVRQQTRHWDEGDGRTHTLRDKEDADDYRYFLEPDLVPLVPDPASGSRRSVPRCRCCPPRAGPDSLRHRDSTPTARRWLRSSTAGRTTMYSRCMPAGGDIGRAVVHVKEAFAEMGADPALPAADLAGVTALEASGALTATQAKTVVADLIERGGGDAASVAAEKGFEAMATGELESLVDAAIAAEPDAWAKFCAGEGKAMGALVGHVMKASRGQADGKLVSRILTNRKP